MLNINVMLMSAWGSALIGVLIGAVVAGVGTYFVVQFLQKQKLGKDNAKAKSLLEEAKLEAKNLKKEAVLEAKEEAFRLTSECDQELKSRRAEMQRAENRISQREEFLDKKEETIEKKNEAIEKTKQELAEKEQKVQKKIDEQNQVLEKMNLELERIAKLSREEAKKELISKYEEEAKKDAAIIVRNIEAQAKEEASKKAKEIVTLAIQKTAVDHTSEITVSTVPLPNDEVKGRIIGREGRNIRALESATGVDLIIDDTPEAVVLSSFDPVRREIARISLEKLILDGRIHPARIEEMVEKVTKDIENTIKEEGEAAVFDAGVHGMHPELIKVLGRLKYRTSYGQNVLKHSLEVGYIAGLLAAEVGANVQIAKRGGLLHDIGKAIDHETEGTHVTIGVELATKYKESKEVIHCIAAHHGGVEYESLEAILVQTADAISSSRPGARRESIEAYIKRLTQLEEIANGFKGVETSFAIQAGREIRIIVKPEEVSDEQALFMAKDIARKVEKEMEYPGQIKVNVIRETRNVDYAK
ncbi:MAG: ribonuclease Y [Clostridiales bacterium]|nr:ribonuclease Y [Clostridiales bacterium]